MESAINTATHGKHKYCWEQNFEGIIVYVDIPDGLKKADIHVQFEPRKLSIRLGQDIEIDGTLCQATDSAEGTWLVDDGKLEVHLTKALKGEVWNCVFQGDATLSELNKETDKKRILLERLQNEHPGFDFSDAEFNGMVPEPRTFMKDI
ncbi:CS domain-containing protein, putative [Babesia ovis]|uniref:CS domain-containing protein, putative n=1 Tax=Babesia ovis TaxID=5869 RepID=A0A9W5TCI5_BABOV|nr:CS domain-containing protein, putative [Babesia ovis]